MRRPTSRCRRGRPRAAWTSSTALEQRRTTREFAATALSPEDLSAILWAANGVNRPDGRRTAPTAMNRQYIELYLVGETGAWRYDAPAHALVPVTAANVKDRMARQAHVAAASHVLVIVADTTRVPGSDETRLLWAHSTAGAIAAERAPHGGRPRHRHGDGGRDQGR